MTNGWSFAASGESPRQLGSALNRSLDIEAERQDVDAKEKQKMIDSAHSIVELLETDLWGSGPFTASVSASANSVYLAVTAR